MGCYFIEGGNHFSEGLRNDRNMDGMPQASEGHSLLLRMLDVCMCSKVFVYFA
jgi:hypothetical protein